MTAKRDKDYSTKSGKNGTGGLSDLEFHLYIIHYSVLKCVYELLFQLW